MTYLEYPGLTRIYGEPAYENLKELKRKLQANAATVICSLEGGGNACLGLGLTAAEYVNVSSAAYSKPVQLYVLCIPNNTSQHESIRHKAEHDNLYRIYYEVINIERSLNKLITQALDAVYMRDFRGGMTNQIWDAIPTILEELFSSYGYVEPKFITELEMKTHEMNYVIHDPIVTIFYEIEDLRDLADAA